MLFRLVVVALTLALFSGCSPVRETKVDEQRNPYFIEGRERIGTRDYKGAMAAFEKALEVNPRSALAHFELAVLYEQHSDQREDDYVFALYHYNQVVRLRPHAYPADTARQRMAACKQELVRSQSMAPVYQQTIREIDRLKDENQQLRRQLEAVNVQAASRFVAPAGIGAADSQSSPQVYGASASERTRLATQLKGSLSELAGNDTPIIVATNPVAGAKDRAVALPAAKATGRTHTVRAGDTAFSIARSYRVRLEALLAANPGLDAKHMKIGQPITIPSP